MVPLWNLGTNRMEHFDWKKTSATFYFYHSGCSPCELKRILEHINLEQVRNEQANIYVFSFQASLTDLQASLNENSAYLKIFFDKDDCFDLGFLETGHIENPIMIQKRISAGGRNEIN